MSDALKVDLLDDAHFLKDACRPNARALENCGRAKRARADNNHALCSNNMDIAVRSR